MKAVKKKREECSPSSLNAIAAGQRSINSTLLFRNSNKSTQTTGASPSPLSLSDFLRRKLHKSRVLPSSIHIQGKPQSASSCGVNNASESRSLSDGAMCMFKDVGKRKLLRWNDVGGKRLAVLGEGLKPSTSRALYYYNHYENGGGWWDDRREGVDDEEVGSKAEAWEGFGTATL